MSKVSDAVKDPKWQRLRESFIGTWKHTPAENIAKLREYLGKDAMHPNSRKFIQVFNYLVGSGFRIGIISHPKIDKLLSELREVKRRSK